MAIEGKVRTFINDIQFDYSKLFVTHNILLVYKLKYLTSSFWPTNISDPNYN